VKIEAPGEHEIPGSAGAERPKPLNRLKALWREDKPAFGILVTMPSVQTIQVLAHAGFDWLIVDLEHGPIDLASAHAMIVATAGTQATKRRRDFWSGRYGYQLALATRCGSDPINLDATPPRTPQFQVGEVEVGQKQFGLLFLKTRPAAVPAYSQHTQSPGAPKVQTAEFAPHIPLEHQLALPVTAVQASFACATVIVPEATQS